MTRNKILLIDDDPDTVTLYAIIVNKMGFGDCFTAARSGKDALSYLEKCKEFPDIILVDINMDGMNGFEFVERFEAFYFKKNPNTTVIILSSSVRESDKAKSFEYRSVREFLSKPLSQKKIRELINSEEYHEHA